MNQASSSVGIPQRVKPLIGALEVPQNSLEEIFLKVGAELCGCAELLEQVKQKFASLPEDLNSPMLDEGTERLVRIGGRVAEIAAEMGNPRDDLDRLSKALANASPPIDQLRRTVKMMEIIATNARVGAASMVASGEDFAAFTGDVSGLSTSMAATVSEFYAIYKKLASVVSQAARTRSQFVSTQVGPLVAVAKILAEKLAAVTDQRRKAASMSHETSRLSKAISEKIGNAVMGLQVGDAVRQRLEHVVSALKLVAEGAVNADDLLTLIELERLQLEGARQMLTGEMSAAATAVTLLAADVQTLLVSSGHAHGKVDVKQSALEELRVSVQQALKVLHSCELEREKLDMIAVQVSRTVNDLLRRVKSVEEIESKMRIVSLNAVIRCSGLEQRGRALNVIAQQLRELTRDTVLAAGAAVAKMKDATSISSEFSQSLDVGDAKSISMLEEDAKAALSLLEDVSHRLNDAFFDLSRDVPRVKHRLHHVCTLLGENSSIATQISDVEMVLLEFGTATDSSITDFGLFRSIRSTYTMDAERSIHDLRVGGQAEAEDDEVSAKDVENDDQSLDSLLF